MDTKKEIMSIVQEDGSIDEVEVLVSFEFTDTKKAYVVYTKNEVDTKLNAKANANNVYSKSQVDTKVNAKANANAVYTKTEVDNKVNPKADKSTTYTKNEVNNLVNSTSQVPDYSAAISITPNKSFTAQFNGVLEIYADFNATGGISVSLGTSLDKSKIILGCSSGVASDIFFGGQAIILKGQTYYFNGNISNLYRAIIAPFKSVTK